MGPAELMKRLRLRAAEEKDKQASSKEIALIRKLLRADDANDRENILVDAFTPRENLLVQGTPENAAKALEGRHQIKTNLCRMSHHLTLSTPVKQLC